jgi:hypothetical protein
MSRESIVAEINAEIKRLQQALVLLGAENHSAASQRTTKSGGAAKRKLSDAARNRIAAAQRARWAKIRAAKKK